MAINFVGDNDHGNVGIPLSVTLWAEITKLREEVVRLNNVIKELKSLDQHSESVANSCQKISTQHDDLFQKLAQEKKTNG